MKYIVKQVELLRNEMFQTVNSFSEKQVDKINFFVNYNYSFDDPKLSMEYGFNEEKNLLTVTHSLTKGFTVSFETDVDGNKTNNQKSFLYEIDACLFIEQNF